jgi:hypothetical protein
VALPSAVTFGTVVAKFLTATADSPDDVDRDPEGLPATGLSITFSPALDPAIARVPSASPPVIFALADVPATIGSDGTLRGSDGQPGVKLVAGANPLLDPYGWPWQVTITGPGFPKLSFSFALAGGDTVDLASVVQVPKAPGQTLAQWLGAVTDAQAARDAAIAAAASVPSAASLAATYPTFATTRGIALVNALIYGS